MTTQTLVRERLSRARNEQMSIDVLQTDPQLVVEVTNEEGTTDTSTYTVIPAIAHCDCPDSRYRQATCKHMLHVLLQDNDVGDRAREAMQDNYASTVDEYEQTMDRADQLRDRVEAYDTVLAELNEADVRDGTKRSSVGNIVDRVLGR